MRLATVTGYYGTGSSAVTDLLEEYRGVKSLGCNFECRIAHDMHGLSDLEYYLVENNHRHNSSIAIKQFLRLMDIYGLSKKLRFENYPSVFGKAYAEAVQEYIKALSPIVFNGGSHIDLYEMPDNKIAWLKIKNRLHRKLFKETITVDDESFRYRKCTPLEKARRSCISYSPYPKDVFLEATKAFTHKLFSQFNAPQVQYLLVDQLLPPTNCARYIRYFDDIKVVVVDRDPRDVYYLEKHLWRSGVIPTNVESFVGWYKNTRAHKRFENDDINRIMRINFEDLVFHYENTVADIELFLGIDMQNHIQPLEKFDPSISVKNIGKWKDDISEIDSIRIIEKEIMQ